VHGYTKSACSVFRDLTKDDLGLTNNSKQHISRVEHVF